MSWTSVSQTLTPEGQAELIAQAAKDLQGLTLVDIRDRARLTGRALAAVQKAAIWSLYIFQMSLYLMGRMTNLLGFSSRRGSGRGPWVWLK